MNPNLYKWLKYQWKISNHSKYQKYFEEWVDNLTNDQILGFSHNMTADYVNHNI